MKKKFVFIVFYVIIIFILSGCIHYRYIPEERLKIDFNENFRVEYVKTIAMPYITLQDENKEIYKIYPSNPDDNILIFVQLCAINITDRDQYFGDTSSESYLIVNREDLYMSLQNRVLTSKEQKLVKANESKIINILFEVPRELWMDPWKGQLVYTKPGESDINIYFRNRY